MSDSRVRRRKLLTCSLGWLVLWGLGSVWAFTWSARFTLSEALHSPTLAPPFGTDAFGRNILFLTLKASSSSLLLAFASVAIVFLTGLLLCASVTLGPRWFRFTFKRGLEFFLALPSLLLALSFAALRGPGWDTLIVALLLGALPPFLRLIVARSEEILAQDYVTASRSLGATPVGLFVRHLLPGILSFASVKIPNLLASALMAEASLSFVGIGAPLGGESWGLLLAQGRDYLIEAPHIAIVSGIPLILTILALQHLSEDFFQSLPNRDKLSR